MIWLTWRQFRPQATGAAGAMLVLAAGLLTLGTFARHSYNTTIVGCGLSNQCGPAQIDFNHHYLLPVRLLGVLLQAAAGFIGAFWGAPLVAGELEAGTGKLVWTQSVSRNRWLVTKLVLLGVVSAVVAGLFSLMLTWAARPYDRLTGNRFAALTFAARDLTPVGYAVFAFVLGTTLGLFLRRTLPAMALTLVVFAGLQILMPLAVRPHLVPPVALRVPINTASLETGVGFYLDGATLPSGAPAPGTKIFVENYERPGAWVLNPTSQLLTSRGQAPDPVAAQACMNLPAAAQSGPAGPQVAGTCLSKLNLHFDVQYQPAGRYWLFQVLETAIFLALALALAGLCFWVMSRRLA